MSHYATGAFEEHANNGDRRERSSWSTGGPRRSLFALNFQALRAGARVLGSSVLLAAGYFISGCVLIAALHKPFAPDRAGVWHFGDEYSLHLGFGAAPATIPGQEILGWWLVPIGVLFGGLSVFGLTKMGLAVAGWDRTFWPHQFAERFPHRALRSIKRNWRAALELTLVVGVLLADRSHLVPFSNTPFLLPLGWVSLRARKLSWRSAGLVQPDSWLNTILLGIRAGLALECVSLLVTEPLIGWATGVSPDRSDMRPVIGNPLMLSVALLLNWTLAAFGEEMAWRGYVLNRLGDLIGGKGVGQIVSLLLASALFGAAHGESQGVGGMLQEGFAGLVLGAMYVASGRRLAVPVLAHGASNTLALVMIYFNRYPGL